MKVKNLVTYKVNYPWRYCPALNAVKEHGITFMLKGNIKEITVLLNSWRK